MIQIHILDVIIPIFLIAFLLGIVFLLLAFWKKNPKDYLRAGIFLSIGVVAFFGIVFAPSYEEAEEVAVEDEPIVEAVAPAEEVEEEPEEEKDIHKFSSDNPITPAIFIAILEKEELSEYGEFVYDDDLEALTFTMDMDNDMWPIVLLGAMGDTEDYDQLKLWFEGISETLWDELEVPLAVINPESPDKSLLWYKNGELIFDLIQEMADSYEIE